MAQRDLLKRYLDAGMAFTAMSKTRAEAIVRELVRAGEIQRDQVQSQVDELLEWETEQPTDEEIVGLLMVALYRAGRRDQAIDSFRRADKRLRGAYNAGAGPQLDRSCSETARVSPAASMRAHRQTALTLLVRRKASADARRPGRCRLAPRK